MDCGHNKSFNKRELLHSQGLIQILPLNILADVFISDWSSIVFIGTEIHPGSMIVLIVNNIHLIIPVIFNVVFFLFDLCALKNNNFILTLLDDFVFNLLLFLCFGSIESSSANGFFQQQILLKVFTLECFVLVWLPLPTITNFDQMLPCPFELIRREFSVHLKDILFRRGTPLCPYLLNHIIGNIFSPVKPAHQVIFIYYQILV